MTSRAKVRHALDTIEEVLGGSDEVAAIALWHILTALRGPDAGSEGAKDAITKHIRRRAFPNLETEPCLWYDDCLIGGQTGAFFARYVNKDQPTAADCFGCKQPVHFRAHANSARESLDRIGR